MGVQQTDVWVMLKPHAEWPADVTRDRLVERMSTSLSDAVPGANFGFSQPIEMRVDELVAGVKADVAVLIYGDDLDTLGNLGKQIEGALREIRGAADVRADWQANVPTVQIDARSDQLARHGIDGIEGIRVTSDPDMSVFEFGPDPDSPVTVDMDGICDVMDARGWNLDRQNGGLHLMLSPGHDAVAAEFVSDLAAAVADHGSGDGSTHVYGGVVD
jgi:hypothetical protein